jgi:hypothetical protein
MKGCSGSIDPKFSVSFQSRGVSPTLTALRAGRSGRRPALVPSPSYSGERDRVRGGRWSALEFRRVRIADHLSTRVGERSAVRTLRKCIVHSTHFFDARPLTPALSPGYEGEGVGRSFAPPGPARPGSDSTAQSRTTWGARTRPPFVDWDGRASSVCRASVHEFRRSPSTQRLVKS